MFNWLIKKEEKYIPLSEEAYYRKFGIEKSKKTQKYEYKVTDKNKLEKIYEQIWKIRNFEIDKYWTRVAYFWGFIVLIFGGYISVITSDDIDKIKNMHIDFLLLLLGFLFSLAWYLVSLGSKTWQLNWEAHIDWLEDIIAYPIYKTIYYKHNKFYSVSKINEVMAIIIMLVWAGLIIQNLLTNYTFLKGKIDWFATISLLLTLVFTIVLLRGYCYGGYKSDKEGFIERW
ncbi:hypothetical protein FACS1894106_0200 [Spirochaetia bacterium]|nr:hypothetical protein FACS1894106_0200 [Spirochaetia bacterium]